jgi:GDP-L-fucose synthase
VRVIGFRGDIVFDPSRLDGIPRKLMDSSRLRVLGWQANVNSLTGFEAAYQTFS